MGETQKLHETSADFHNHHATYEGFVRFAAIGTAWVLCIVVGLAIGGTTQRWWLCGLIVLLGSIGGIIGIASKSIGAKPAIGVLVLGLLALLLVNY